MNIHTLELVLYIKAWKKTEIQFNRNDQTQLQLSGTKMTFGCRPPTIPTMEIFKRKVMIHLNTFTK